MRTVLAKVLPEYLLLCSSIGHGEATLGIFGLSHGCIAVHIGTINGHRWEFPKIGDTNIVP